MPKFPSVLLRWALPFLGIFLILRLIFWATLFPNPDEAYYWLWGQHPGFSYYDHPPFHAWVQGIFARLLGRAHWVLRLPTLLSTALLLGIYYRICQDFFPDIALRRFLGTVLLLASSPLFFLFLALAWNDHWLVVFSAIASYCFVRFLDGYAADGYAAGRGRSGWLYGAALALGLAALCKYTAVFVGLGFLATVVSDRRLWGLLREGRSYGAMGLTLLTLSPILIWNGQHDFLSFQFYANRSGAGGMALNPLQPLVFWLLCGLILGPVQSWGIYRVVRDRFLNPAPPPSYYSRVALGIFALSTGAFTLLSLVKVALYYWNILAYPLMFPWMAEVFVRVDDPGLESEQEVDTSQIRQAGGARSPLSSPFRQQRLLWVAQLLGITAVATLIWHYRVMPLTAFLGNTVDPDSAALFGWGQVAAAVEQQAATLEQPLLLTTDYRSASALAYELNNPQVMAISGRRDQFDLWYDVAAMQGRDAVLLGETWHPICPAHLGMFQRTDPPMEVTVQRFGYLLQTYTVVRGYGFQAGPRDRYPLGADYPLAFTSDGEICGSP